MQTDKATNSPARSFVGEPIRAEPADSSSRAAPESVLRRRKPVGVVPPFAAVMPPRRAESTAWAGASTGFSLADIAQPDATSFEDQLDAVLLDLGDEAVERNLLTTAQLKPDQAEGDAALTTYLDRIANRYRSAEPAVSTDHFDALQRVAADPSLSDAHRARGAAMLPPLVPSLVENYADPLAPKDVRRAALSRLRTMMASESIAPDVRHDIRTTLERINADRLRRTLDVDGHDLAIAFENRTDFDEPNSRFKSALGFAAGPLLRYQPVVAAERVLMLGGMLVGLTGLPYVFRDSFIPESLPLPFGQGVGKIFKMVGLSWAGSVAGGLVAWAAVEGSSAISRVAVNARLTDSVQRPRLDSSGVDRTPEVAELMEGLFGELTDSDLRMYLALNFLHAATFTQRDDLDLSWENRQIPETGFATALADFVGTQDELHAMRALEIIASHPLWNPLKRQGPGGAEPERVRALDSSRSAIYQALDERREKTDVAMRKLGYSYADLDEPDVLTQVKAELGDHEPLHGEGLQVALNACVVDDTKFPQPSPDEIIRQRLLELRHQIVAAPGSEPAGIAGLQERFDVLIVEARDGIAKARAARRAGPSSAAAAGASAQAA